MMEEFSRECEEMIRKGSSTFYNAFSFLESPRREAVFVIYAFCRLIDDSVDEPEEAPFTLEELRHSFDHLENASGHFIWPALRWLFSEFPITKQPFYNQMDGQAYDNVRTSINTFYEFEAYCYDVAGTVGEMLLPVLHDNPDEKIRTSGIYLGKAMQIVNIIRDIGEDLRLGKRYLPLDLMQKHRYEETQLHNHEINENFIAMLEDLRHTASDWFKKGLAYLNDYPSRSAFCIELASVAYGEILDVVERNRYEVFTKRAIVSDDRKLEIFFQLNQRYQLSNPEVSNVVS